MPIGTNNDDTLVANPADTTTLGLGGEDLLIGHSGSDLQVGGLGLDTILGLGGDDTYLFDSADLLYDGGIGEDTVRTVGQSVMDVTFGAHMENIEIIDLNDGVANSVDAIGGGVFLQDVIAMTDSDNTLKIEGEVGDSITLNSAEWALVDVVDGFEIYQGIEGGIGGGLVTLEVDAALSVVI